MNNHAELVGLVAEELPRLVSDMSALSLRSSAGTGGIGDLTFRLRGDGIDLPLHVEVRDEVRPTEVEALAVLTAEAREAGAYLSVVAPRLDARTRASLRAAGVSHADLTGTVYLHAPGVAISVEGTALRPARRVEVQEPNPFADRASLVLRAMLREPGRAWGVRELASSLSVSTGLVSQTASVALRRGYLREDGGRLRVGDASALLVDWLAELPWRKNHVRSFVVPAAEGEMVGAVWPVLDAISGGRAAFTQLTALSAYAPSIAGVDQAHVYIAPEHCDAAEAAVISALNAQPVRRGGNLHIVRPAARRSTWFDARTIGGVRHVSPVQLLLDLASYPARGVEGAANLLRAVLAPELGLDRRDVARVTAFLEAR